MIKVKNFITKMSHSPNRNRSSIRKRPSIPSPYEATSEKIQLLLNIGDIRTAVAVLSTMQAEYLLKCIPTLPIKHMKRMLPQTLPVWEVLLDKINDIEDDSIPQSVYAAYDSLVLHCAHKMLHLQTSPMANSDTELVAINQLLRKVYLQYPEIIERFVGLREQTASAIHCLLQHFPLQLENAVVSLQEAIRDEVSSSIQDFQESLKNLNSFTSQEKFSFSEMMINSHLPQERDSSPSPTSPMNQIQMQERLYVNQAVLRTIQPTRRNGNLAILSEMLMHRIQGDKEVLSLFGHLRKELEIGNDVSVETCLRKHQQALELVIISLRRIKQDVDGEGGFPTNLREARLSTPACLSTPEERHSTNGIRHPSLGDFREDNRRFFGASSLVSQNTSAHSVDSLSIRGNLSPVNNGLTMTVRTIEKSHSTVSTNGCKSKSLSSIRSARNSPTSKSNPGLFDSDLGEASQNSSPFSGGSVIKSTCPNNELSCFQELELKKTELQQAQDMIQQLKVREKDLMQRISEQAQRQLENSTIFEDLSLGANRPTQLIRRYQELYSQGRVEVIDVLEELGLDEHQRIAVPLDIMQMSFMVVESTLQEIGINWKKALFVTEQASSAALQLEKGVNAYLRKDCNPHKLPLLEGVETTLWDKYSVTEAVKSSSTIRKFIQDCVELAWALAVQNNRMTVSCEETVFVSDFHNRFFTANPNNHKIQAYLWPVLLQMTSESQNVLFKGVVIT